MSSRSQAKSPGLLSRVFRVGKSKEKVPSPPEAIEMIKDLLEMMDRKQEYLEGLIAKELAAAKAHGMRDKRRALQCLKRKNRILKQQENLDKIMTNLDFQKEALESASTNVEVVKIMQTAGNTLKAVHRQHDVDKVYETMDDLADEMEMAKEITEAIANPISGADDYDDDELMRELEEMEQEDLDKIMITIPSEGVEQIPSIPSPPSSPLASRAGEAGTSRARETDKSRRKVEVQEEEDELSRLASWAS